MGIGSLLRACRERAGLTQMQLAQKLHIEQSCISRIEKGKQSVDAYILQKWVTITQTQEVAVAFLFGIDGASIIQKILPLIGG